MLMWTGLTQFSVGTSGRYPYAAMKRGFHDRTILYFITALLPAP